MEGVSPEPLRSELDSKSKHDTAKEDDDALKDSTEAEVTKIRLMRAFVESRDPSSKVPTYIIVSYPKELKLSRFFFFFTTKLTVITFFPFSLFKSFVAFWCQRLINIVSDRYLVNYEVRTPQFFVVFDVRHVSMSMSDTNTTLVLRFIF